MQTLKPCPFCGGKASIERKGDRRMSTIYSCDWCGCSLETGEEWDHGKAWNTRPMPAATDTGLETVGGEYLDGHTWKPMPAGVTDFALRGFKTRALCDRSQAVELLAAERARYVEASQRATNEESLKDIMHRGLRRWKERAEKAEADNAAKDARIKALVSENFRLCELNAVLMGDDEDKPRYTTKRLKQEIARATEALEAKLAAAEKVRLAAEHVIWFDWSDNDDDAVKAVSDLRAVLGGKPS